MRLALAAVGLTLTLATPASAFDSAKVISWGASQVGHHENGTSNCSSRINRWEKAMGLRVPPCRPWCGAFVHQAFLRGGIRLSARLIDPHRSYLDAVAGRRKLRAIPKGDVRPGDLLFFKFRSGVKASHLAIVRTRPKGGRVRTLEGNVSHAAVAKRRGLRFAVLAARVG